jgi:PAS domain S-box-containing protein
MRNRVLIIEDDKVDQMAFKRFIKEEDLPYDYTIVGSVLDAREILDSKKFDIIITDYLLSDGTAFDILDFKLDIPIIFVTGAGDEKIAVKAMKRGAYDYLIKDQGYNYLNILSVTVDNAIKRKKADERLRLLESSVVNANDAIVIFEAKSGDLTGRQILYVNRAFTDMTGYSLEEVINKTIRILYGPKTSRAKLNKIREMLDRWETVKVELTNYRKDGSEFWVECNMVPVADEKGSFTHWVSIQRDITIRKRMENQIKASVKEKEVLLGEIHHRVGNNLQVIYGLLNIQSEYFKDKQYFDVFKGCQNRIMSMALVHKILYKSTDITNIDFHDYISKLADRLFYSYGVSTERVSLNINVSDSSFGVDTAIPCGLIINELISNSLKHAFPEGREGEIKITLRSIEEDAFELIVSDNGIGIPEDIDFRNTNTLGFKTLISFEDSKSWGKFELNRTEGTEFRITFNA